MSRNAAQDFKTLIAAVRVWVENHMDQWEKLKFEGKYGTVYVTIAMHDTYPNSFDLVSDAEAEAAETLLNRGVQ